MSERLSIHKEFEQSELQWTCVLERLMSRQKLTFLAASELVNSFVRKIRRPFYLYWFLRSRLSEQDNLLATCLSECQGADSLSISVRHSFSLAFLNIRYQHTIRLVPRFGGDIETRGTGSSHCVVKVGVSTFEANFEKWYSVFLAQCCLFIVATFVYAALMGALLYSIAVFTMFLAAPGHVALAATESASIGLALLCFLTVVAALFGRAVRNISADIWRGMSALRFKFRQGSKKTARKE